MATRPLLSMITDLTSTIHGYPTPAHSPTNEQVTCWLVDTRRMWPGNNIVTAPGAARALSLVSTAERHAITTKVFVQDARMSLASALIKRLFVCKTLGISWHEVRLGRKDNAKHGKPCAVDATGLPLDGIDFNVSHQGGLVALVGYDGRRAQDFTPSGMVYALISPTTRAPRVTVGVDIVCVNERDDYRTIDADGFDEWVDMYDYVFSAEERWSMKYDVDHITLLDGTLLRRDEIGRHDRCTSRNQYLSLVTPGGRSCTFSSERIIEAKLRRFYTYFCYKEAYIKLSGEALLAPWLRQLEFFNVRSPKPGVPPRCSTHGVWGETVEDVEVLLHGRTLQDVRIKIQALEEDFMLSSAMQGEIAGLKLPSFTSLDLGAEIKACTGDDISHSHSNARVVDLSSPAALRRIEFPPTVSDQPQHTHHRGASASSMRNLHMHSGGRDSPAVGGGGVENPYAHMNEVPLCLM